jgi:hypothetical protein
VANMWERRNSYTVRKEAAQISKRIRGILLKWNLLKHDKIGVRRFRLIKYRYTCGRPL